MSHSAIASGAEHTTASMRILAAAPVVVTAPRPSPRTRSQTAWSESPMTMRSTRATSVEGVH